MAAPGGYPGYEGYPPAGAPPAGAPAPAGPYAAYQQPAYGVPPVAAPGQYGAYGAHPDEIRTVFVTGFPNDVKERELNNMLRFLPGYEASQMHWKNGQAQGFALFETGAGATNALNSIHNLVFDDNTVLRCELARKNMYIKEDTVVKRGRFDAPPPPHAPGAAAGYYGAPPPGAAGGYYPPAPAPATGPRAYVPVTNTRDNPPCNTLFIGNLGDTTREEELRALLGTQPGFRQLKISRGAKAVTAFAEFVDIPTAMHVHQTQQGAVLSSSDRGGIRIQYSKNPFGRKRDYNGNYVSDGAPDSGLTSPGHDAPASGGGADLAAAYGQPPAAAGQEASAAGGGEVYPGPPPVGGGVPGEQPPQAAYGQQVAGGQTAEGQPQAAA